MVHEGVVVSVCESEVVEYLVLGADGIVSLCTAGTVVPGECHGAPAVVEVDRQHELVLHHVADDGGHLRLAVLQLQLLAQVGPVRETSVEVLLVTLYISDRKNI